MIRAGIAAGDLEPGVIYSATSLAERLEVSPTPVREAMLDLTRDGLVEAIRNRGFRVLTVSDKDLDEICELRIMLEVPAMRNVIARASDEDLRALEEPMEAIEAAASEGALPAFLLADRSFHLGLLELGGNTRLVQLVVQLRDQTRLAGLKWLAREGRLLTSAREHPPILEAVRQRDVKRAEELMVAHLRHTRGIWAGRPEDEAAVAQDGDSTKGG